MVFLFLFHIEKQRRNRVKGARGRRKEVINYFFIITMLQYRIACDTMQLIAIEV